MDYWFTGIAMPIFIIVLLCICYGLNEQTRRLLTLIVLLNERITELEQK